MRLDLNAYAGRMKIRARKGAVDSRWVEVEAAGAEKRVEALVLSIRWIPIATREVVLHRDARRPRRIEGISDGQVVKMRKVVELLESCCG